MQRFFALLTTCWAFAASAEEPVGVLAAEVMRKPFHERIEALGTLRANESVDITANVTETITAIGFEDNQRVEAGAVLAEMTSAEEQAQLEEARSTYREAKQQYYRVSKLAKQGNAPRALRDEERREMETAKARLTAVESRLKDRLIMAPFSGVVGLRNISVGALVEPGDIITTLDDDAQMKLDFDVPAVYLASITPGLAIRATSRAFGERVFEGKVTSINSRIDPVTRSFTVRAVLPNAEHLLRPGMLMQVNILANPRETLVISEAALVPLGDKQFVFKVTGETVQKVPVSIGSRRPGEVELLGGLEEGEKVVIDGTIKLRDGAKVQLKEKAF